MDAIELLTTTKGVRKRIDFCRQQGSIAGPPDEPWTQNQGLHLI